MDNCNGYAITYRWVASDDCGNETTVSTVFNVLPDSSGPSFDSQPSAISDISCNDNLPIQETLTASDLCGVTNVTASVDDFIVDNCAGYAITYRWVASDDCGNETTVSTVFNVLPDSSGPSFDSQPSAISDISCNDNLPIQETLTASDLCLSLIHI